MALKVGINGIGRIGRAILRIILQRDDISVVAINDINPDIENIAYLLKYDSTYGRLAQNVTTEKDHLLIGQENRIRVFHQDQIDNVSWKETGADIVIDASGVRKNLLLAPNLKKQGVDRVIVTNSPAVEDIDTTLILGVNHETFDPKKHFVISSSICDANAFAPVARILDENFGIEHGFLTTLHPWLNYQNLLDGPSISYATPGQVHDYYALGRGSTDSLIPKTTSAVSASLKVLDHLKGKFLSMSYRIPTMIVSSADMSVCLRKKTTPEEVKQVFLDYEKNQKWKTIYNNQEALVSIDFRGNEYSAIIDHRWIMMNDQNYLKMIWWYDNEWGYSYSVVELLDYINQRLTR